MTDATVIEVPQWQGAATPRARELAAGARLLAATVPAARRSAVPVREDAGPVSDGVRSLDVLVEIAGDVRARLAEAGDGLVVTAGGDCGVELAPVSAASARYGEELAVVWFDAHGDLNTPASSPSHAFHGMVLRTLLGEGPAALVPERPLRPDQVVLAGGRVLDPAEREFIAAAGVRRVVDVHPGAVADAVASTGATAVYVHIDLDVFEPTVFRSLNCPEPDGIMPDRLRAAVDALTGRFELAGLGITEYLPEREEDQETLADLVPALLGR